MNKKILGVTFIFPLFFSSAQSSQYAPIEEIGKSLLGNALPQSNSQQVVSPHPQPSRLISTTNTGDLSQLEREIETNQLLAQQQYTPGNSLLQPTSTRQDRGQNLARRAQHRNDRNDLQTSYDPNNKVNESNSDK